MGSYSTVARLMSVRVGATLLRDMYRVAGLGDPAPDVDADVPYAYKVVHSKRDEVRRLYVLVRKHEFCIQEQDFVFTSRTQPR